MDTSDKPRSVDAYLAQKPVAQQPILQEMRAIIRAVLPDAQELIAWGMPSYKGHSYIVHFAAYQSHLGLYPGPEAIEHFQDRLKAYQTSKGAIHLPYDQPLPKELIQDIALYCAAKDQAKS